MTGFHLGLGEEQDLGIWKGETEFSGGSISLGKYEVDFVLLWFQVKIVKQWYFAASLN